MSNSIILLFDSCIFKLVISLKLVPPIKNKKNYSSLLLYFNTVE